MKLRIPIQNLSLAVLGASIALVALLGAACNTPGGGPDGAIPGGKRTIYLTAMEFKGSTEVSQEAFPTKELPSGGGYVLKPPTGTPAKWEVDAYAWSPGSFVVAEGDEVTLRIIGTNGGTHSASIQGHIERFPVERGKLTSVTFLAGEPGIYDLSCNTHAPNMTAQMVVLPRK